MPFTTGSEDLDDLEDLTEDPGELVSFPPNNFSDPRPDVYFVPRWSDNYLHVIVGSVVLRCDEASRGSFELYIARGSPTLDSALRLVLCFALIFVLIYLFFVSSARTSGSSAVTARQLVASNRALWNRVPLFPGTGWVLVPNCHVYILCILGDSIGMYLSSL